MSDPQHAGWITRGLVGQPLPALVTLAGRSSQAAADGQRCDSYRLAKHSVDRDGRPIGAPRLVTALESAPGPERRWLLAPLTRLTAEEGGTLSLCLSRDVPDLERRLSHPSLRIVWEESWSGLLDGPGPYRMQSADRFTARQGAAAPFREVRLVTGDPSLLLRLGEADVGTVFGEEGRALRSRPELVLARMPSRDRTYFLWFQRRNRWVNDPRLRRWMAGVVSTDALAQDLFADGASPASNLVGSPASAAVRPSAGGRPLADGSTPRLSLGYARGDRHAEALARRLAAEWEARRMVIELVDLGRDETAVDVRIVPHRAVLGDAVLDLACTLAAGGVAAPAAMHLLDQASRWPAGEQRDRAAALAETALLESAEAAPLVTVHAWRVTRAGFDVPADPGGPGDAEWWLWNP